MTDDELTPWLRRTARARDARLGAVAEPDPTRLARLRALAGTASAHGAGGPVSAWRLLAPVCAAVLACAALWREPAPEPRAPAAARAVGASHVALSPLLVAARPEASLLEADDIRLDLAATAPPPAQLFLLTDDGRWPAVGDVFPPGGSGL